MFLSVDIPLRTFIYYLIKGVLTWTKRVKKAIIFLEQVILKMELLIMPKTMAKEPLKFG